MDVRAEQDIIGLVLKMVSGKEARYSSEEKAAVQLVDVVRARGKPVLIHIDETGSHKGHDLKFLQLFVRAVWTKLWRVRSPFRVPCLWCTFW